MTTGYPKVDMVNINSVNVDDYKVIGPGGNTWKIIPTNNRVNISTANIYLSKSVDDVLTVDNSLHGKIVIIQRLITPASYTIFRGNVIKIEDKGGYYLIVAADKLNLTAKRKITKSFDINIDSEAGVYSEIFKTLINDYTSLSATDVSVENTGTTNVARKFICANTSVLERIKKIAETLGMKVFYNSDNDLVYLQSKGAINQSTILQTSDNILNNPDWKSNSDKLFNSVEVRGAVQEVGTTETGQIGVTTGYSTTEVQLSETPSTVKVWSDSSNPPTTLRKGGVDSSTTDADYTVDVDTKKIIWTDNYTPGGSDYVLIDYTTIRPRPVMVTDEDSIQDYTNGEEQEIVLTIKDMKDRDDALLYANQYLNDHKDPIESAVLKVTNVSDLTIGQRVYVQDDINTKIGYYFIKGLSYTGPYRYDEITVVSNILDEGEYTWDIQKRIKRLEEETDGVDDILLHLKSGFLLITPTLDDPDFTRQKICDSFIAGHYVNNIIGIGTSLDNFNTGSAANWSGTSFTLTDSSDQALVGSESMKAVWAGGAATGTIQNTTSFGDLSSYTGVASGAPSQGTIGIWVYITTADDITDMILRIGSGASNYSEISGTAYASVDGYDQWSNLSFTTQAGWNYILFDLDNGSETGTPNWTAVDFVEINIVFAANKTIYFDYFTISESNYIALNGISTRKMVIG